VSFSPVDNQLRGASSSRVFFGELGDAVKIENTLLTEEVQLWPPFPL
jgi:hypothetical protein